MENREKDLHIRIQADLHAMIKAAAKADCRSMQSYIADRMRKVSSRELKEVSR